MALVGAGALAAPASAGPVHAIWSGPGLAHGGLGFITDPSGRVVYNIAGTLTKPDPGDPVTFPPGICGLPAGPYAAPILPDGSFYVRGPATMGTVEIAGRFTSPTTAQGVYRFTYDCYFAGPGPVPMEWHATAIDILEPGDPQPAPPPAPDPSPQPSPGPLPLPRIDLPDRQRARLCARSLPGWRAFDRGGRSRRQSCTRWTRLRSRAALARHARRAAPSATGEIGPCQPNQHARSGEPGAVHGYEGRGTWCRRLPLAVRLEVRGRPRDIPLGALTVNERLTDQGRSTKPRPVRVRRFSYQLEWQPQARLRGAKVRLLAACSVRGGSGCGRDARTNSVGAGRSTVRNVRIALPATRPGTRQRAINRYRLELGARGLPDFGALRGVLQSPRMRGARHGRAKTWIFPTYVPTIPLPQSAQAGMPNIVAHMKNAQAQGKPGAPGGEPLEKVDDHRQDRNRRIACSRAKRSRWPGGWPPGASCEEYPFASTRQGGHGAVITPVPPAEQNVQGGALNKWYDRLQILPGDRFWVTATP